LDQWECTECHSLNGPRRNRCYHCGSAGGADRTAGQASDKSFYLICAVAIAAIVILAGLSAVTLLGAGEVPVAPLDNPIALGGSRSRSTPSPSAATPVSVKPSPSPTPFVQPTPAPTPTPTPEPYEPPPVQPGTLASSNWAGHALLAKELHGVYGEWTQPAVECINGQSHVSFWVGLDGAGSHTVEQIGTAAGCGNVHGIPADHYAWWEMYPLPMKRITLEVHAGDHFKARVEATSATRFELTLDNVTTGQSFTTTASRAGPWPTSAEWIVEPTARCARGMTSCVDEALAQFEGVTFTNIEATTDAGPVALEKARRKLQRLDIRSKSSGHPRLAATSVLKSASEGFYVVWIASRAR
jgi:hypothetical protein